MGGEEKSNRKGVFGMGNVNRNKGAVAIKSHEMKRLVRIGVLEWGVETISHRQKNSQFKGGKDRKVPLVAWLRGEDKEDLPSNQDGGTTLGGKGTVCHLTGDNQLRNYMDDRDM